MRRSPMILALTFAALALGCAVDPLPTWADAEAKLQIVGFVERVTTRGSREFVAPAERIAVFDNDGTLWSEQPMYVQLAFALDRVKALAPAHPEWKDEEPFRSVLAGDLGSLAKQGEGALVKLITATHAGMTSEEFEHLVREWLAAARHPRSDRPYTAMVYQPMRELIAYLEAHEFRVFLVSGGGLEFLRPWVEEVYGIPRERVIGSTLRAQYESRDGQPAIVRLPEIEFIDDKAGKPLGIERHIGRRPIAAFGNSDGDFEMLEWTTSGPGARLGVLVHHDDGTREVAYDRTSPFGKLARGLDEATQRGWLVVSMKSDWKTIFPAPR
ncbi:MAG: haloacid dehalogenase-like hydrolase [Planctomycetes bacterium]|nr:haloacid dehalogenase-like hydrolase [Planctomycetota bacterium]